MADASIGTCAWCEGSLPARHRAGQRYCRPAHRQAAYQHRRAEAARLHTSLNSQAAMAFLIDDVQSRLTALTALLSELADGPDPCRQLAPGRHPRARRR